MASAPQPARPVAAALYSGRWYEIARTSNARQKDCRADTIDFSGSATGAFTVLETCRKASGAASLNRAGGRLLPETGNAKFTMSFLAGLVRQQYWILDHADDNGWALMATPGGHYIWLLSRQPVMAPGAKASAVARMKALGYDPSRLEFAGSHTP